MIKHFNNDGSSWILKNRYQQLEDMVFYQLIPFRLDEASGTWRGDYRLAALTITMQAMDKPDEAVGLLGDFLRNVRGMNSYITENSDAVRQEFEAVVKRGWQDRGIRAMATEISAFFLGTGDRAEMVNASQMGGKYTGVMFAGGGNDRLYGTVGDDSGCAKKSAGPRKEEKRRKLLV